MLNQSKPNSKNSISRDFDLEGFPRSRTSIIKEMLAASDEMNISKSLEFCTDDIQYRFGNFPAVFGKQEIKKSMTSFLQNFKSLKHDVESIKEIGETVICEMKINYIRYDDRMFTLPCCNVFEMKGDLVQEMRIFMDVTPVFDSPVDKIALVMEMEQAGGEFNWDYFQTFFTDDVMFKVGASEEGRGWKTIADYLIWLYSIAEPQLPFTFRGTWDLPGTVIVEMDAKYVRLSDRKPVSFPCTDILRFDENNKVTEWRVYPDQSELWMECIKTQAQ